MFKRSPRNSVLKSELTFLHLVGRIIRMSQKKKNLKQSKQRKRRIL